MRNNTSLSSLLIEPTRNPSSVNVFKDMVNANVENATVANFGTSSGLLGSFPHGVMLARDGAAVIEVRSNGKVHCGSVTTPQLIPSILV